MTAPQRGELADTAPIRIPLGADLELRFITIVDDDGNPGVEAGLWRCSPGDATRDFCRTSAAWRVGAHLWPAVLEATRKVGVRVGKLASRKAERSLFAVTPGDDGGA